MYRTVVSGRMWTREPTHDPRRFRRKTSRIRRRLERHVAVRAVLSLRWIIKRPRALKRNPARLPIVVIVEPPHPAIVVHRNVEMNFVARRAKFRSLRAHERFQEHA